MHTTCTHKAHNMHTHNANTYTHTMHTHTHTHTHMHTHTHTCIHTHTHMHTHIHTQMHTNNTGGSSSIPSGHILCSTDDSTATSCYSTGWSTLIKCCWLTCINYIGITAYYIVVLHNACVMGVCNHMHKHTYVYKQYVHTTDTAGIDRQTYTDMQRQTNTKAYSYIQYKCDWICKNHP